MKVVRIDHRVLKNNKRVEQQFRKTEKFKTQDVNRILKDLGLIDKPQNFSVDEITSNIVVFRDGIFGVEIGYVYTENDVTQEAMIHFNGQDANWYTGQLVSQNY